jgi:hypothetical protein
MIRTYYGRLIHPAGRNSSGIRYWAFADRGGFLRADTLESIRELIRAEPTVKVRRTR